MSSFGKSLRHHPANDSSLDVPAHSIRISRRAKRIGLRVLPDKGLEVVLPPHADPACVPELLVRHRAWIEKALTRVHGRQLLGETGHTVPDRLLLKGGIEEVRIRRLPAPDLSQAQAPPAPAIPESHGRLPVPVPVLSHRELALATDSSAAAFHRLREWIREEARLYLGALLEELAGRHGFSYSALSIRFQRSRWGSCSAKGNISLNACLLFLPERLTRYILLHELCHTRELNHSQAFWRQLFAVDPHALAHDKGMRRAWGHVPAWIFTGTRGA